MEPIGFQSELPALLLERTSGVQVFRFDPPAQGTDEEYAAN